MESQSELLDSMQNGNWNNLYHFSDSLVFKGIPKLDNYYKFYDGDVDIKLEMEQLEIELKKFRVEMKQWKEEFKREVQSQDKDKNSLK